MATPDRGTGVPRVSERRRRTVRQRQEAVPHRGIEMRGRRCRSRRSRRRDRRRPARGPSRDECAAARPPAAIGAAIVPSLAGHRGNGAPGSGERSGVRIHARSARRADLLLGAGRDHAHRLRAPADSGQDRLARRGRRSCAPNDRRSVDRVDPGGARSRARALPDRPRLPARARHGRRQALRISRRRAGDLGRSSRCSSGSSSRSCRPIVLFVRHGKEARKQSVPLGPFLALGGVIALFWGGAILDWYQGLGGQ